MVEYHAKVNYDQLTVLTGKRGVFSDFASIDSNPNSNPTVDFWHNKSIGTEFFMTK